MFTGLIRAIGKVNSLEKKGKSMVIAVDIVPKNDEPFRVDESIAINGVCLTVTNVSKSRVTFDAVEETLMKSTLGHLKVGDEVNIERAMLATERFGGHIVQGHVDTIGKILSVIEEGNSWRFQISFDLKFKNWIVAKGSICIDGISLTVASIKDNTFEVAIIPYTYANTILKHKKAGEVVNLEFDIVGKYIEKITASYFSQEPSTAITLDSLVKSGFKESGY
ncbi:MAG: riboflavin synthase [Chloroherpetonaceae bacterium]|nr:riboflavin synthase [Chloroherpetonaceae bacterium]